MSWLNKVKTELIIETGDGKQYKPNWLNAKKVKEYNVSEFNFPNVAGTLVDRKEPKGGRYNLEIYFQGENHLELAAAFETSADDKRYWTVTHPFYGKIFAQPTSLLFDSTKYNVTKVTGEIVETITDTNPKTNVIPEDKIDEDIQFNNADIEESFNNDVVLESQDLNSMSELHSNSYKSNTRTIVDDLDNQGYFNALNNAENTIRTVTSTAGQNIRAAQTFIEAPARFKQSVESRLDMLERNYTSLRATIDGSLENVSNNTRKIYESFGSSTLMAMALAASIPFDVNDYDIRSKITDVTERLIGLQNQFITDLDYLQSGSGGDVVDYIPDARSIQNLNSIFNFTVSNLFNIALDAKQERFYVVPEDTDIISLAFTLYGLEQDDSTIDELIKNNDLGLNSMLLIPKGTIIKYYI